MRSHLLTLFALVACSSAPEKQSTLPDSLRDQWTAKVASASQTMRLLAATTPLGPQTLTLRQCSATVNGHLAAVMTGDRWVVQVPAEGAMVTGYASSADAGGATLNLWGGEVHGDEAAGHIAVFRRQLALPKRVFAGDSLIVWSATTPAALAAISAGQSHPDQRGDYPLGMGGRSRCDQAMPVVFVSWAPSPDVLGPPALGGSSFWPVFFRASPMPRSALNVASLPRVVNPALLAAVPLAQVEALFSRFCGDCYGGWHTDEFTPDHQSPGYGRDIARCTSFASLWLIADIPNEQKQRLAQNVAQWGFDLLAAYADGRKQDVDGGHGAGRKADVVWLGHLLNIDIICEMSAFLGPVANEDRACQLGTWALMPQWTVIHRPRENGDATGAHLARLPSTWSANEKRLVQGYTNPYIGTQIGTALAMRRIGRTSAWAPLVDRMIEQWMGPVPQSVRDAYASAGARLDFGQDTSYPTGGGVQAECWRLYAAP